MENRNLTVNDLLKYIDWDKNILEIVISMNLIGLKYDCKKKSLKNSLIDNFENEFNKSIYSKKKELLYSGLRYYKKELDKFKIVPELPNTNDEWYYQSKNYYANQSLINKIFVTYSNGYNPTLKDFKEEIILALEEGIDQYEFYLSLEDDYFKDKSENEISLDIISKHVYDKFELVVSTIDFLEYLQDKCRDFDNGAEIIADANRKLVWKGTPAHFALIIDLLIDRGYLEKPTKFSIRNARILLQHFDFTDGNNPSEDSLGNILHKDFYPIKNQQHIDKFKAIPKREDLDK